MSRFHGLLLVRDEEDIIEECLRANLEWADTVWVLDTGSTDATWDIVTRMAHSEPRIRAVGRRELLFGQHLRSYLFHAARGEFEEGDWVVKLDADEFFEIAPPKFVRDFVAPSEGCVHLQWIYFRITADELAAYERGEVDVAADRRQPIAERRRHYKLPEHTEPRMFRYRGSMKFAGTDSAPRFAGLVARRLIPIRHYPHRDPVQMERRYALRSRMKAMGSLEGGHWDAADWRIDVVGHRAPGGRGAAGAPGGLGREVGHDSGPLRHWTPGEPLPSTLDRAYDEPAARRLAKRIFYGWFVGIADRFARGFRDDGFLERNGLRAAPAMAAPASARGGEAA